MAVESLPSILVHNAPAACLLLAYSINTFPCGRPDHPDDPPCGRDNDFDLNVLNYGPIFVRPVGLPTPAELAARHPN